MSLKILNLRDCVKLVYGVVSIFEIEKDITIFLHFQIFVDFFIPYDLFLRTTVLVERNLPMQVFFTIKAIL